MKPIIGDFIIDHPPVAIEANQHDRISYTSQQLREWGQIYLNSKSIRSVPDYQTIRNIKENKINRRRIRLGKKVEKIGIAES